MNEVLCEHPVIICHPRLPELIAKYRHYFWRGKEYRKIRPRHPYDFRWSDFSVRKNKICHDDLENCYVVDDKTGECYSIYLEVPCNHCDICKSRKINAFVHRCMLETECYDCKPWFITLTYDEQHKPEHGVEKRDVQLFLKRFRINLKRAGFDFFIRYVAVGEYGKTTHRPHYHLIVWNLQSYTDVQFLKVASIIDVSWQQGFIQRRLIDPSDSKSFFYTSKYLKKDCEVPIGCNPTFMLSSRKNGGIGSRFIDEHKDELRRTLNTNFKFLSKWQNKIINLQFSQYVFNRIFPSFCKSVSSVLRTAVVGFYSVSRFMYQKYSILNNFNDYDYFNNYIYLCGDLPVPALFRPFNLTACKEIIKDYSRIISSELLRISNKTGLGIEQFLKKAEEIQEMRQRFIGRLFEYSYPIDKRMKSYQCHKFLNYQSTITHYV